MLSHTRLTYSTLLPPYINQTLYQVHVVRILNRQTDGTCTPETFYEVLSLLHTRRAKMAPFSQRATAPQQLRARFSLIAGGTTAWQQALRYIRGGDKAERQFAVVRCRSESYQRINQPTRSQSLNFATTTVTGCCESE